MTGQHSTAREAVIARLAAHRVLGGAPRAELEWLADHGTLDRFHPGDAVVRKGETVDQMVIVFSGVFGIHVDRGSGPRKVMEWRAGDVSGLLPFSRLTYAPGFSTVEETAEVLQIHRNDLPALVQACPVVTAACVHTMLDRARAFNSAELLDEKMVSLGRLAAGLAHELNNPASAAARNAHLIAEAIEEADLAARALGAFRVPDSQMEALRALRERCVGNGGGPALSAMDRADREDAIAEWLAGEGVDTAAAAPLSETALTLDALRELSQMFRGGELDAAIRWIAAACTLHALTHELETCAARIHELVGAVKRFTHMDRPLVPEPLHLAQGLRDTATMLGAKARARAVTITASVPDDLPAVRASPEINQVWANLLDNALDASPESGRVAVTAQFEAPWVVVRITDNGPGVPDEIATRIFDPFFTTKPVGQGTGLGLDIARRILRQWDAEIDFTSRPGATEFRVAVRAADGAATG